MIVGTAGHIDHGKTALVHALTGVDADRLPEEKKRGITIELGYAALEVPGSEPIGFVDVPGHEKLVRTMVAGASGMDIALLLIAADDGVMPQTREHLVILSMLGVRQLVVVITKIDKVDPDTQAQRVREAQALCDSDGWSDVPHFAVSAVNGEGIDTLKTYLLSQAQAWAQHQASLSSPADGFRMALDRAFTLDGIGTVVAGSIASGEVRVGDALCLAHAPDRTYRVRSLHSHHRSMIKARAGQRCAIGLVGLDRDLVARGQTLCDPRIAITTQRPEVLLTVAASEEKMLRSGTRVHVHTGTMDVLASVAILGQASIAPGESALVQLLTQQPVHVWWGDRVVLRDASASRTLAGGPVIEPEGLARYRQTPQRLQYLHGQTTVNAMARLSSALAHATYGISASATLRAHGWVHWPFELREISGLVLDEAQSWLVHASQLQAHESAVLSMLQRFHTQWPEEVGPDLQRARRLCLPRMPEALWAGLISQLVKQSKLGSRHGFLHLPEHGEQLRQADLVVAQRALPLLLQGRFDPPWIRDMAADTRLPETQLRSVLSRLAKTGQVHQVVKDLYYHPKVVQELSQLARELIAEHGALVAADFRDATGLGRKRAIQILEFFDRIGFLRRVGDHHLLRPGTALFAPMEQAA